MENFEDRIASAYSAHQQGQLERAASMYRALLAERPVQADVLYLLSSLLLDADPGESCDLAAQSWSAFQAHGALGVAASALLDHYAVCLARDDRDPALESDILIEAERRDPGKTDRLFRLAEAQRRSGKSLEAMHTLARYLGAVPDDANALCNLGALQLQNDAVAESINTFRRVLALVPDHVQALTNLATAQVRLNLLDEAESTYRMALKIQPDHPLATLGLNHVYTQVVPRWHFVMMNDRLRNEAYDAAIRLAVQRKAADLGSAPVVLEIGAGSGLLSMMAARAGAKHVFACEMVKPVAEMATEIVARNGFADRVTVIHKKSTALVVGADLPQKADLLVSEIFDAGLLGEHVLPAITHARDQLLKDDALIIPGRATVWMMPVQSPQVHDLFCVRNENACGFDFEPFNRFAKLSYEQQAIQHYAYDALAKPVAVLDFDFSSDVPDREREIDLPLTQSGLLHAWVFWFSLDFDGETLFDTGPFAAGSCWAQAVQVEFAPRQVLAQQTLRVQVSQTRTAIRFGFSDPVPK